MLDDDFEFTADGKRILKDGRRLRTPMVMMDAVQRSLADARRRKRVGRDPEGREAWSEEELEEDAMLHDGRGGPVGHRPGFVVADSARARAVVKEAYRAYDQRLENAYKFVDGEGEASAIGNKCTCRNEMFPEHVGAPGTVRRYKGQIVCVPDALTEERADRRTTDDMATLYADYDAKISEAWRTK